VLLRVEELEEQRNKGAKLTLGKRRDWGKVVLILSFFFTIQIYLN